MEKQRIRIEEWAVVDDVISPSYRDLEPGRRLTGTVFAHADLPNGIIYTSSIVRVDTARGVVETQNRLYVLGQVSDEYRRWREQREMDRAA
ncbi:MAG: hypothetical protein WA294_00640 [Acidobacteriaceae bacterium]